MFKKYNFAKIGSTNEIAKRLLESTDAVLVETLQQTKGKGRNGKKWVGEKAQNIYVSFGFKTEKGETGEEISKYQMLGSLTVLKTLREIAPQVTFKLKYPNDILAENEFLKGKISGVLCEHEFLGMLCFSTIIGIGINVNQEKFDDVVDNTPVSLKNLNMEADRETILQKLEENIIELLKENRKNIFKLWKRELKILGKNVVVKGSEGEWKVSEILADGRLKVLKKSEMRIIDNGDSIRYQL